MNTSTAMAAPATAEQTWCQMRWAVRPGAAGPCVQRGAVAGGSPAPQAPAQQPSSAARAPSAAHRGQCVMMLFPEQHMLTPYPCTPFKVGDEKAGIQVRVLVSKMAKSGPSVAIGDVGRASNVDSACLLWRGVKVAVAVVIGHAHRVPVLRTRCLGALLRLGLALRSMRPPLTFPKLSAAGDIVGHGHHAVILRARPPIHTSLHWCCPAPASNWQRAQSLAALTCRYLSILYGCLPKSAAKP